tara:strand:+ start:14093 stop:14251 length:159 start_codon:yes stop_codon:yes gene_type:complete
MDSLIQSLLTPQNMFFGLLVIVQMRGVKAYAEIEKRVSFNEYKIEQIQNYEK